jgi:hypothetical protein
LWCEARIVAAQTARALTSPRKTIFSATPTVPEKT